MKPPERRVLTVLETAAYLNVSKATIYRLLKRNDIPAFRIGVGNRVSDWRFNIEQLDKWRFERENPPALHTGIRI